MKNVLVAFALLAALGVSEVSAANEYLQLAQAQQKKKQKDCDSICKNRETTQMRQNCHRNCIAGEVGNPYTKRK
jgi:hypothetical protein